MQDTQIFSVKLADKELGTVEHNYLCLVSSSLEVLQVQKTEYLHQLELEYFTKLQYPLRQTSYLRGRYAAKLALAQLRADIHSAAIAVCNNIFGAPYLRCERGIEGAVSISHTDAYAAAISYVQAYPMAVDIEQISPQRLEIIQHEMLPQEIDLANNRFADKSLGLTIAWTAKEALSKALGCGLCIDFKYLQISEFNESAASYNCKFKNFPQYQATSLVFNTNVCTLVSPDKCEIEILKKL